MYFLLKIAIIKNNYFFFHAEDGIRYRNVTGVQTCALPISDPILVTDPGGVTLLMNAPAEKLFAAASEAASEVLVRVQSNDAHFSSFHANVLFASGTKIGRASWRERVETFAGAAAL